MFLPSNITLKPGDSGDFVAELQRRLAVMDCFGHDAINGFYDGMTANGVSAFQSRSGIATDGIAGPETLRRLNGVISGDTSNGSTDTKQEEEVQQAAAPPMWQQEAIAAQQPTLSPFVEAEAAVETARALDPFGTPNAGAQTSQFAPPPQAISAEEQMQHHMQQQLLREPLTQQHAPEHPAAEVHAVPQQSASDMLAQMLLQTPAPAQAAAHAPQQQGAAHEAARPAEAVAHQQAPQASPHQMAATATEPQQPRGIVGRAMQYANEMVQKLGNYFESKLPPSVLNEVQSIGQSMMRSGVKEVPIPAEPTARAELPARGPEQAHAAQRG
jgi:peptidoglycan hydrolase-like protein with peptidoglycan-binding domain